MPLTAPIEIGSASSQAIHAADLGKLLWLNGKAYRVCKVNSVAITSAAKKVVTSAVSSGQPTWVVSINATAADKYKQKFRAVVPEGQTGTGSTTTTLAAGDYFLAQVSGPTKILTSAAVTAGGSLFLVVNSLGKVAASTLTTAIACRASIGFGTHTANASAADVTIGANLIGLI